MKRPLEHIIEEESRKQFALIVPNEWAANDFTKDYGKDIHLEIFKNYESTGKIFISQLKGTSQKIVDDVIKISMEIDHLQYFESLSLPVLLVFYSTQTKGFWAIWANCLLQTLNVKPGQKTVQVKLGAKNMICKGFFEQLTDNFEDHLPKKINIMFDGKSDYFEIIKSKMLLWTDSFFKEHYELNNSYLPLQTQILMIEDNGQLYCAVTGPFNQGILDPVSIESDMSSLFRNSIDNRRLCEVENGLLYLLGSVFAKHSFKKSLEILSYCLHSYKGRYKTFQTLIVISETAIEENCTVELQLLVERAISNDKYDDFQALNFGFFKAEQNRHAMLSIFENNMLKAIEGLKDGEHRGTICYNLGSIYRNRGDFYKAGEYYQKARRIYPVYLSRAYWWMEYAGILAQAGHMYFASKFYKKFIEMDSQSDRFVFALGLLADAQFRSAQFKESFESVNKYLEEIRKIEKAPDFIFLLIRQVISWMQDSGLTGYKYDPNRSDQLLDIELGNPENGFLESLSADPMNGSSLYNQGIYLRGRGHLEDALPYFLAAAVMAGEDMEFWITILESYLELEDEESGYAILTAMIQIFGITIVNELTDRVAESGASLELKKGMVSTYQRLVKTINEEFLVHWYRPSEQIVRMLPPEIDNQ